MGKVLGVLGGMGPAATVAFLEQLQALTPAAGDADHIRVIADINPRVPNRNTEPEAAGRELARMAAALRDAGAEVLAMPCNTAHAHAAAMRDVMTTDLRPGLAAMSTPVWAIYASDADGGAPATPTPSPSV